MFGISSRTQMGGKASRSNEGEEAPSIGQGFFYAHFKESRKNQFNMWVKPPKASIY